MAQLKMYWMPNTLINSSPLPDGYSISNYKTEADMLAWCDCCKNGLVKDDAGKEDFDREITSREDIAPFEDVFFLDYLGEHIGTITAYVIKEENVGDVHMVGIKTEFRGKGLSKYMLSAALTHLKKKGVKYALLTTDEWRKGAVKSYLTAGFLPVQYNEGMEERWQAVLKEHGIESVQMLNEDASPYKIIYANK